MTDIKYRLRHTMLPVQDLDRSIDFYTRVLGMSLVRERRGPDNPTPTAYVGYGPEATYPALELITNTGHHDKPWYGHIAVVVSDLKALCARIDAAGIKLSRPLKEGGKASSNTYFAYVRDPDGFEIELTEQKDGRV